MARAPVDVVAYLGPEGTFSELAARAMFGERARLLARPSFEAVLAAVLAGRARAGVVPIQNAIAGTVPGAADALLTTRLRISREHVEPVRLALLSRASSVSRVRRVASHPHALAQCGRWLAAHARRAELVATPSTAAAAALAAEDPTVAALASPPLAARLGLAVLADDVADDPGNATRFVAVSARDAARTGRDRTTLVFGVDDGPGALRRALEALERHGVNLTQLVSRPSPKRAWAYLFVCDVDGHRRDPHVAAGLGALRATARGLRVLGSYPRATPP